LLICTILLAAWVSYVKGRDLWKKENIEFAKKKKEAESKKDDPAPAKKTLELEDDKPLDENALYKIVNGKPVPIDKNEMATILELYQVAQIEISDEPHPSEIHADDLPVHKTGLSQSKKGFGMNQDNEYGSYNYVPEKKDQDNKLMIVGENGSREFNSSNPMNSERNDLNMMSSPNRNIRLQNDPNDVNINVKKMSGDAKDMPRSSSG
jgi:hypothetical protein